MSGEFLVIFIFSPFVSRRTPREFFSILMLRDLIIAAPEELNETEAMAEGIGHESELAPFVCSDRLLEPRSSR